MQECKLFSISKILTIKNPTAVSPQLMCVGLEKLLQSLGCKNMYVINGEEVRQLTPSWMTRTKVKRLHLVTKSEANKLQSNYNRLTPVYSKSLKMSWDHHSVLPRIDVYVIALLLDGICWEELQGHQCNEVARFQTTEPIEANTTFRTWCVC